MNPCFSIARQALVCAMVSLPLFCAAQTDSFPLQMPDRSTPRAAVASCMEAMANAAEGVHDGLSRDALLLLFRRADDCLDLRGVPPERRAAVATETGLLLYEVMLRAGVPDPESLPTAEALRDNGVSALRIPRTNFVLQRVDDASALGEWAFAVDSLSDLLSDYESVRHLPNVTLYPDGTYENYVSRPAVGLPTASIEKLPAWATFRFLRNPAWKWLAVAFAVFAAVVIAAVVRSASRRTVAKPAHRGVRPPVMPLVSGIVLAALPLAVNWLSVNLIGFRFEAAAVLAKTMTLAAFAAAVYTVFTFAHFVAETRISMRQVRDRSVNAHLIRVTAQIVAMTATIVLFLQGTDYLGFALAPVLAGLGIGGLAIALAARPTLENIIGGFTLFADKPVRVGDYCVFGDREGTVEEIGLRSTRVRTRDDKLITIPNADFSQMALANNALIRERLYRPTIGVRYETTPDQLRFLIAELREMLLSHPRVSRDGLYVRLLGFGDYSIDIEIFVRLKTSNWETSLAIREDINLRIMDIVKASGTAFAFPSQTAYLTRDTALPAEEIAEAEAKVAAWRDKGQLPFPDFGSDDKSAFAGRLDYPPTGSALNSDSPKQAGEK